VSEANTNQATPVKKKKEKIVCQSTRKERVLLPFFSMGQNMSGSMIKDYMLLFMTDVLFINPLVCSAMLLVTRVWDAINDPLFGIIVDRARFKGGKFKPWMRIASFAVPLTTALIFLVPADMPMGWKIGLVVAFYALWDLAFTMADVPNMSMLTALTGNIEERTHILSLTGLIGIIGTLIFSVGLVPRLETIGFKTVALIVAGLALLFMLPFPYIARERNRETIVAEERYKLKDIWEYMKGNKYLLYFFTFFCIFGMCNIPLGTYVITNCLPGGLANVAYYTLAGIPFLLGSYVVIPKLAQKFDRLKMFKTLIFTLIGLYIISYFVGYSNAVLFGVFYVARAACVVAAMLLLLTFSTDFVEYGNYKTGMRKEGMTFAAQTFSAKFVYATAAAMAGVVLGFIHYNGELTVQTESTLQWLWLLANAVPVAGTLIGLPFLMKVNYRTKDIQVMANINNGTVTCEEGEAQLSRAY